MAGSFFKNGALIESSATTATATGTTTLTASSATNQQFTGTLSQTIVLPDATTLSIGRRFTILNRSTQSLAVNYNGGTSATTIPAGSQADLRVIANGTSAGTWDIALASAGSGGVGNAVAQLSPTVQKLTSGTGTYTMPAGVTYIRVRMVGGGGGGSGSGTGGVGSGGAGGTTTFGTSFLTATGGGGGNGSSLAGGTGGTATLAAGAVGTALSGGSGQGGPDGTATYGGAGGNGAATPFGGAGGGGGITIAGQAAVTNTGSGGGAGGAPNAGSALGGAGGGAGGFLDVVIGAPLSTYTYAIGAGGTFGTAGSSGQVGGAGGSGYIEVTEYYAVTGSVISGSTGVVAQALPTVQKFLSSSGTYFTPSSVAYIRVRMVGGGGGGAGTSSGGTTGTAGTLSTFGTSFLTANGGAAGTGGGAGGVGGTATFTSGAVGTALQGAHGQGGTVSGLNNTQGGTGGATPFGGAGGGGQFNGNGYDAIANTGSGGGGAGGTTSGGQGGGGAGGFLDVIIASPGASYGYAIGTGGAGGAGSDAGGAGGSGYIEVTEYYSVNGAISSSGAQKNYLGTVNGINGNGDFELNSTTKWSLFNTTLTSLIPTGAITAGAASITTFATTATNKLAGAYSLNVASSGVLAAGAGFISDAFTLDREDRATTQVIRFAYSVESGTVNQSGSSSNTFAVYAYDVTNSKWLQPSGVYNMAGSSKVMATFQPDSTCLSLRLAIVCINATSGAVSLLFDDFAVGPQINSTVPVITDLVKDTSLTINGMTATAIQIFKAQRGDTLKLRGFATAGAVGATVFSIPLPAGLRIDSTKMPTSPTQVGWLDRHTSTAQAFAGASAGPWLLYYDGGTTLDRIFMSVGPNSNTVSAANTNNFNNGEGFSFELEVPILGWSSNVNASTDTDSRVCALRVNTATGTISTASNPVIYSTVEKDTHAGYNASTGQYTVKVAGWYDVQAQIAWTGANGVGYAYVCQLNLNGSSYAYGVDKSWASTTDNIYPKVNTLIYCNVGDVLNIQSQSQGGSGTYINGQATFLAIFRLTGPATVAAADSIAAKFYGTNATSSIAASGTCPIALPTAEYDTHGVYVTSTGVFSCPGPGIYEISAQIQGDRQSAYAVGQYQFLYASKNGEASSNQNTFAVRTYDGNGGANVFPVLIGSVTRKCNQGDTLQVVLSNNSSTGGMTSINGWVSFRRVG